MRPLKVQAANNFRSKGLLGKLHAYELRARDHLKDLDAKNGVKYDNTLLWTEIILDLGLEFAPHILS